MMLDVLITGGEVYDGTGGPAVRADVGIAGDRIAWIGPPGPEGTKAAGLVIDAAGKAVCPGFINILSHSNLSILHDPRSLGELTQGVTTEVFGEGISMGPLTPQMKADLERNRDGLDYDVCWTRLSEYLAHVERRGTAQNVASFIGGGTIRVNVVGYDDRPATAAEMDRMQALVGEEMADGALGIASALIYPPGSYASTTELTDLCRVAAGFGGCYASHIRSEGEDLLGALAEFLQICRDAGLAGEVFHLKAAGRAHWDKMDGDCRPGHVRRPAPALGGGERGRGQRPGRGVRRRLRRPPARPLAGRPGHPQVTGAGPGPAALDPDSARAAVAGVAAACSGHVGLAARHLDTSEELSWNPDATIDTASTVKVAIGHARLPVPPAGRPARRHGRRPSSIGADDYHTAVPAGQVPVPPRLPGGGRAGRVARGASAGHQPQDRVRRRLPRRHRAALPARERRRGRLLRGRGPADRPDHVGAR
jgi:hypothetical protein